MGNKVTYTMIFTDIMKKYNLTANEYMIIDIIARLSRRVGYCYATRQWLAEQLNMTKQGLLLLVDRLMKRKLLFKNEKNKLYTPESWLNETDGIKQDNGKESSNDGKDNSDSVNLFDLESKESLPNKESIQINKQKDTLPEKSDWTQVKDFYKEKLKILMDEEPYIDWKYFTKMINPIFKEWGKEKTIKALEGFFGDPWVKDNGYPISVFKNDPNRYLGISKYDPKEGLGWDEYFEREAQKVDKMRAQPSIGAPEFLNDKM